MTKLVVDDNLIVDAFLVVLVRNKAQHNGRELRLLQARDTQTIHQLRRKLATERVVEEVTSENYHAWRKGKLTQMAREEDWSAATTNLYSSLLSTIGNWVRQGVVNLKAQRIIDQKSPGADLLLPFILRPYQPQLKGL